MTNTVHSCLIAYSVAKIQLITSSFHMFSELITILHLDYKNLIGLAGHVLLLKYDALGEAEVFFVCIITGLCF